MVVVLESGTMGDTAHAEVGQITVIEYLDENMGCVLEEEGIVREIIK